MKTLKLFLIISLLSTSVSYAQLSIEQYRSPEITKDEIYSHIEYLASKELGGRLNGTKGDILAQQYLSSELEKYGYVPKGDSAYLQKFNLRSKSYVGNYMGPLKLLINSYPYDIKPEDVQLMPISANGHAKGTIIFAGFGDVDNLFDANGLEVSINGKVVIMIDSVPMGDYIGEFNMKYYKRLSDKILALKSKNPAGVIVIRSDNIYTNGEGSLINNESALFYFNSGLPVINIRKNVAVDFMNSYGYDINLIQDKIEMTNRPDCFDLKESYIEFKDDINRRFIKSANVIGYIEGSDPALKNEVIVIGAHFDHVGAEGRSNGICLGADDNASGTAGVLEIAQKLSSQKELLKRSVLVMFFGAEEGGLNGSAYFTQSEELNKYNIVAMFNFDMIGRLRNDSLILYRYFELPVSVEKIDELNARYNFKLTYPNVLDGRSDQRSFLAKEIPVLAFFNGLHKDYHTPGDVPEKINRDGAYRIVSFGYDIIYYLCTKN